MEAMLLALKESYEVFSVWLLGEGNCKMKSQSGENHSVLKAVNPGWVLESWNCRKEGKEQLKLVKLFGAHSPIKSLC